MSDKKRDQNDEATEPDEELASTTRSSGSYEVVHEIANLFVEEGIDEKRAIPIAAKISSEFSGPTPPPQVLKGYAEIDPSLVDRVLKMAETQLAHDQEMDRRDQELAKQALQAQVEDQKANRASETLGQKSALGISVMSFVLCGIAVYFDADWVAGLMGVGGFSGVAVNLIQGRKRPAGPA